MRSNILSKEGENATRETQHNHRVIFMDQNYPQKTDLSMLPWEIRIKVFDALDVDDHIAIHRTSTTWRRLIIQYLIYKHSIKRNDWRWFCRHNPQRSGCSECLYRIRNKTDNRGLAKDWEWWNNNEQD